MRNFIEDYLVNPSQAIKAAVNEPMDWADNMSDHMIYQQILSPEFRLYEEIIFSSSKERYSREMARV